MVRGVRLDGVASAMAGPERSNSRRPFFAVVWHDQIMPLVEACTNRSTRFRQHVRTRDSSQLSTKLTTHG